MPAFAGLGAPYWDPYARGTLVGMTRGTGAGHVARAALESIAHQTRDVLRAMERDAPCGLRELRVDGGASANTLLMQLQADLLQTSVVRPANTETTAFGAACLAGLATGFWRDRAELSSRWRAERTFAPLRAAANVEPEIRRWERAVALSRNWARPG